MPSSQSSAERSLIDQAAASTIDNPHAVSAEREPPLIEDMMGLLGQRHVQ
jgi:hypothetical protein